MRLTNPRTHKPFLVTILFINFRGVGRSEGHWDEGRGETDDAEAEATLIHQAVALRPGIRHPFEFQRGQFAHEPACRVPDLYLVCDETEGDDEQGGADEPPVAVALARLRLELAAYFAAAIRAFQPEGPYVIAGFCAGGTIAFELARQLLRDGARVSGLALFGAPYSPSYRRLPQLRKRLEARSERLAGPSQGRRS